MAEIYQARRLGELFWNKSRETSAMNAHYRIEQWLERIRQPGGKMLREDVCFLMVQHRHLIESSVAREKYKLASFYADWTVHSQLDRSEISLEMLKDITSLVAANFEQTAADLCSKVSEIIGLPRLRRELISLYAEYNLPATVFEYYANWKGFSMFLLWHLAGQPARWPAEPRGRAQRLREEMLAMPRPYNVAVEAIAIVDYGSKYHWMLQMSGEKDFRLVGALDGIEGPDAFRTPPD